MVCSVDESSIRYTQLWQENINIPPAAAKLQFNVRVKKGSAPEQTKLEVYWDTTSGSPAWTTEASAITEEDWQLVEDIPLPTTPNPHTLHFVYKNCRVSDSSRFMIDDIAFKMSKFPLIQVFPAGNLCIENLQLRKGSIGVLNMGGHSKIYRCFIGDQLDKGLEISTGGAATVAHRSYMEILETVFLTCVGLWLFTKAQYAQIWSRCP
jgi:hypothetical protein